MHSQRRWRAEKAERDRNRRDATRIPTLKDVNALWDFMKSWGWPPLKLAAEVLGLKVDGDVLKAIRDRAAASGVDLDEAERDYYRMAEQHKKEFAARGGSS